MAEVRLGKIAKTLGVGVGTLVDFLASKGVTVEANPNSKFSDELLPELEEKFGADIRAKQEAEKVTTKLKEMIEGPSKKEDEPDDFTREVIIKSNLSSEKKAAPAPKEEPRPAEETVVEEADKPKPKEETPVKSEHAPRIAGVKIVAKIELDAKPVRKKEETPKAAEAVEEKPEPAPAPAAAPAAAPQETPEVPASSGTESGSGPAAQKLAGPKVLGKIDLTSQQPPRKKRERIVQGGSRKVDVTKVETSSQGQGRNRRDGGRGSKKNEKDKFRPHLTEAELEEQQREVQKQIKETLARMNEGKGKNNFGARYRKEKREAVAEKLAEEQEIAQAENKTLKVTEFVTVNELATLMNVPVTKVIGACMNLGLMVSINQRLDAEYLVMVAEEFGFKVEFVTASINEAIEEEIEVDKEENMVTRPPVITVMGHVDHGKTSLLDYIRKANVIAGEAGGITQHIGAYHVEMPDGQKITFLDTPGHEAFTAMRARGAKMTDLAIIIIAADDAIMPQTVEAINHAQAAGVPMVFAINKIDKEGANPDRIREQLSNMNILVEDWGGKYQCQEISAKKGINVDKLLEKVLLEAELLDLKANPQKRAVGAVIESSLDKGRGYLATVLVQGGTMRVGDIMLSGPYMGRIKAMFNERGQKVEEAGPSVPVSVLGLNGAPTAGETFNIMADEREAKEIASKREQLLRIQGIKTQKHTTLDDIARRIAIGNFKELNVIVKGDVDGSVEALSDSIIKLSTEEVVVNVIHKAVGQISESDVLLAAASDAVIIGFQVRPSGDARRLAEKEQIEIRLYSVIYDAINEIKSGIEGMLAPEQKEEIVGTAEIKETFKISKVGTIAGCIVKEGKISRTSKVRVIRDGIVVYTGGLGSLKRFKDDAKEVLTGMECGLNIENFNDIKVGDQVEAYQVVEVKRTL